MSRRGENIYKRKDGRWEGRYKKGFAPDGRTLYGYCYGKTYREVKEKLHIFNSPAGNKQAQTNHSKKCFGLYCDEWLSSCKNRVKLSTVITYQTALENHIKPYFGGYLPINITTEAVDGFTNHLLNTKKLSPKSTKTAVKVGSRHGKPVVLKIRAKDFVDDGNELYRSSNGVWQARYVPPAYFTICYTE